MNINVTAVCFYNAFPFFKNGEFIKHLNRDFPRFFCDFCADILAEHGKRSKPNAVFFFAYRSPCAYVGHRALVSHSRVVINRGQRRRRQRVGFFVNYKFVGDSAVVKQSRDRDFIFVYFNKSPDCVAFFLRIKRCMPHLALVCVPSA